MRYGVWGKRKVAMAGVRVNWNPLLQWIDRNYRGVMLAAMAIELVLLSWIAWKA